MRDSLTGDVTTSGNAATANSQNPPSTHDLHFSMARTNLGDYTLEIYQDKH